MLYGFVIGDDEMNLVLTSIWEMGFFCFQRCDDQGRSIDCCLPDVNGKGTISFARDVNVGAKNQYCVSMFVKPSSDEGFIAKFRELQELFCTRFQMID
jgi:hypothetical protein